jgi:iron complex outermembrane receptor protein
MRAYTLLILLLSSILSFSQNCNNTLSGSVIDLHDGTNLTGALLIVEGSEQVVVTDFDGNFTISNLCEDRYLIQVSHAECRTIGFAIEVKGNMNKTFTLEHHLEELNQVIVSGKAYQSKSKSIYEKTLSIADLENFSTGTLGDALNSLSGVSSINTGNLVVKPMINGLHSTRVVLINNGVRVQDQEWGAEHAPNLDINSVGNLTLVKGAGALQYGGDAIGGLIVAEAAKVPVKDSIYGKFSSTAVSNGRGVSLNSQITKSYQSGWYATLQGTLKRFGDFETPEYVLSNTGSFERNASLQFGLNKFSQGFEFYSSIYKNTIGILRASHLGGAEDLYNALQRNKPFVIEDFNYDINAPKQDVTHRLLRLKGFKKFNNFGKLSLQYDYQRNNRLEFDIRRGDNKEEASVDLKLDTHSLMLDLDTRVNDVTNVKSGIMVRYQNNFANPDTGFRRLIPDYDKYDVGLYGIATWEGGNNWLLEAGGRFDFVHMNVFKFYRTSFWESRNYNEFFPEIVVPEKIEGEFGAQVLTNPKFNFHNASATIGAVYNLRAGSKILFNYSLASRAPNPSELFSEGLHHSASRIELGDLRFKSEKDFKFTLTFQKNSGKFSFYISPFVNTINDFILIEPVRIQKDLRGSFQVWEYRQTDAQLVGFDMDASYVFSESFTFKHQLSLVKGQDRIRKEYLINMPPVNTKNEVVYQHKNHSNLRISLQSEYVFRQNEYPDNDFQVFIPTLGTTEEVAISATPDAYHLFHFNSSMDIRINKKSKIKVGLVVTNLLDTSYRNSLNRMRYYADDLGRNVLLNVKIDY